MDPDLNSPEEDGEVFNVIQKIDSTEIIYSQPEIKYRLIGPYIKGDVLGEGSYGKVKECVHSRTLQRCAVKIMKHKVLRRIPNGEQNVRREIQLLQGLSHKNVIKLIDVMHSTSKQKIYMVMDYCVTGLQEMLDNTPKKCFPIWQCHKYFLQLTCGLEYLHSKGIVHKDIKPGNLLLTTNSTLKIIDFGVAEKISSVAPDDLISTSQGSPFFQPPEVAKGTDRFPGFKLDVWSSGVTLFNMCTGSYPFDGANVYRLYENICDKEVDIPAHLDPSLQKLLELMLTKDPFDRISVQNVQRHEWCLRKLVPNHEPPVPLISCKAKRKPAFTAIEAVRYHFYEGDDVSSNQQFISEHDLKKCRNMGESDFAPPAEEGNSQALKTKRRKAKNCIDFKAISVCTHS